MLVLTRKQQQQIQIGDSIKVTILRVKGHTVRVGIEAPRGVRILRKELAEPVDDRGSLAAAVRPGHHSTTTASPGDEPQEPAGSRDHAARPVCLTSLRPYLELAAVGPR